MHQLIAFISGESLSLLNPQNEQFYHNFNIYNFLALNKIRKISHE